ncbi:hypothetical protein [Teredinibacter sp. KSP-S5-2]|uniref:hypothetical protein n=1 Tax=Teredinibacter sp. KSP-S5-2 TaxID=3034506 RepID=UPI002934BA87|nr:hypothetical protein [Teredinibacter sp. KSP-S5-2]WNO11020.1 hypothetical protein P5V12_07505 [Teredinibacter sp. KSP-S5-2]
MTNKNNDGVLTEHITKSGSLYFLPKEKVFLVVILVIASVLALPLILFRAYIELLVLVCVFLIPVVSFGFIPAHNRAKSLLSEESFLIKDGMILKKSNPNFKFSYRNKHLTPLHRKNGVMDLIIGDGMFDFMKFFGSGEKLNITICGLRNGEEVLEYMKSTKNRE